MAASEKVLKEHDTSTQGQINEQLNQLTALTWKRRMVKLI